ncbi:hypothetical protein MTO96_042615 [Rhipicephalus appendiculatus]
MTKDHSSLKRRPGQPCRLDQAHHANKLDVGTAVIVQSILGGNGGFNRNRLLNKGRFLWVQLIDISV